ncbi:outer dynein arm-docking complex subunit 4 [Microcaecilia unicolor]|uniref:Outer dynein arm-docking complex subunit 4 n=1 Tax=Microcaecilia unicolor TaxID=1415580 RepID=A0A6P7ZU09_9AMPH|nr:tetratricopeptide repeat protein 25 [Microcaecilia unicolor]
MAYDDEGDQAPRGTYIGYLAEGEQLYQKGEYRKAIDCYTCSLQHQPADKNCLVARSKCYLKLGKLQLALQDAESSLKLDKEFFRGLYQKAETLYAMGDFEFALVYYHRGYRQRPELQEFRLGIQKAQEAIDNSVGSPSSVKLENKGDLSYFKRQEETKKSKQKVHVLLSKRDLRQQKEKDETVARSEKTVRKLLGRLYTDRAYLTTLLKDEDLVNSNSKTGLKLRDLIIGGITYLDTRTEFWRQQKPIYARERDRRFVQQKWSRNKKTKPSDPTRYILKSLEEIDMLLTHSNPEGSCKKAQHVLKRVEQWTDEDVPNRHELIGNLHSCIGNAQIEMGQMEAALQSQKKDLEIAEKHNLLDAKSRAMDNIGRVYARIGEFQKAIDVWVTKISLTRSSLEKTWLFHEIGRCYLELHNLGEALDYGEKSQAAAEEAGDVEWQLNASVLVAQSEVKLQNYQSAVTNFEKALERAKLLHNKAAEQAIMNALEDANRGIIQQLKAEQEPSLHDDNELETEEEGHYEEDQADPSIQSYAESNKEEE